MPCRGIKNRLENSTACSSFTVSTKNRLTFLHPRKNTYIFTWINFESFETKMIKKKKKEVKAKHRGSRSEFSLMSYISTLD